MKKLLLILLFLPMIGMSQNTDHELEFNSVTQDYVQMPNTSAVIANKTAFSMSCWVNPQANTTHSGIMGFRNNTNADFYLLQLQNTNNLEARFRNSSNVNYDILAPNLLDFNQWQHLALTYDGSNIHLYKDGVLISSTPANGIITQSTQSFRLAGLDYQNDVFHMNGRLDEVRLWDVALSQTEINNWMCIPIDLTHPNYNNLMGYWRLNEGVGITIADFSTNSNNGTLINNPVWQTSTTCLGSTVIYGCTNSLACNYDPLATIDDSSCVYLDIFLSLTNVSCYGGYDGSIEAIATGGTFPLQYSLGSGLSQTSGTFLNLSAGSYYIDVTDINGCTSNQTVTITEPVLLESFDTLNINTSILWNGMNLNTSGNYSDTLTNANGCDSIAYLNLTVTTTGISDISNNKSNLVKITDMLGQETPSRKNIPLFYIFDDGTVEKRIIIE